MEINAHGLACAIRCSRPDSDGWMTTTVEVKVPSFEGKFSCTVELNEWKQLIQVLQQLNDSIGSEMERSWANMEANIEFSFLLRKRGAIEGTYKFSSDNFSLGPTLSGSFEADQTFLALWLRGAQEAIDS